MGEQLPSWMPWALGLMSVITSILIMFMGMFLKGIKIDVSRNTDLTLETKNTVYSLDKSMTEKLHELEVKVMDGYTPLPKHDELRTMCHNLRDDIAPIKAREDLRRLQEQRRVASKG